MINTTKEPDNVTSNANWPSSIDRFARHRDLIGPKEWYCWSIDWSMRLVDPLTKLSGDHRSMGLTDQSTQLSDWSIGLTDPSTKLSDWAIGLTDPSTKLSDWSIGQTNPLIQLSNWSIGLIDPLTKLSRDHWSMGLIDPLTKSGKDPSRLVPKINENIRI